MAVEIGLISLPINVVSVVSVAHEALIREWQRLRGWLDASRADVTVATVALTAAGLGVIGVALAAGAYLLN